ncbi:WD40/YVTN/BNR-like repeat-containing protein [Salegentibacter chungangensis]|uniref:WD40/YVTN/BNR-like repeat-containing protein n=1 Tax=Salegentibacter chungangensis TaxID=1335724 RepID=A0ABW3NTU7_9FLAO
MKRIFYLAILLVFACKSDNKEGKAQVQKPGYFSSVEVEPILEADTLSIRAIEVIGNNLAFAGNKGVYGLYNRQANTWKTNVQKYDTLVPEFRAVASTPNDFFMLSVASPALLYKTGENGKMELVYEEDDEKAFYDSMAFWNDSEGIAMGDPTQNCLSVIITRDAGKTWKKLSCDVLPEAEEGEAAFAASNSNIAVKGDNTWILSGGKRSRVFYSPDKGKTWEVFETPLVQGEATTGGYSIAFYDENNGFIIGGDYTKPKENRANKAVTKDGGKTWQLVGKDKDPGYKSSVRYVPGSNAAELVASGFSGISYSKDSGSTWNKLSEEGFYTLRFIDDSTAYAAGKGRIALLHFK